MAKREKGKNTRDDTFSDPPCWRWGRSTSRYQAKYQPPYPSCYTDLSSRCHKERHPNVPWIWMGMFPLHHSVPGTAGRDWGEAEVRSHSSRGSPVNATAPPDRPALTEPPHTDTPHAWPVRCWLLHGVFWSRRSVNLGRIIRRWAILDLNLDQTDQVLKTYFINLGNIY